MWGGEDVNTEVGLTWHVWTQQRESKRTCRLRRVAESLGVGGGGGGGGLGPKTCLLWQLITPLKSGTHRWIICLRFLPAQGRQGHVPLLHRRVSTTPICWRSGSKSVVGGVHIYYTILCCHNGPTPPRLHEDH